MWCPLCCSSSSILAAVRIDLDVPLCSVTGHRSAAHAHSVPQRLGLTSHSWYTAEAATTVDEEEEERVCVYVCVCAHVCGLLCNCVCVCLCVCLSINHLSIY